MKTDTEIVDWLNDHATFIIVVKDDGEDKALKVAGEDICARDILIKEMEA